MLSQLQKFIMWYFKRETVIRLVIIQLTITAIGMLIAFLNYPGYDITRRTISGLGNHGESPAWPFFTFQTLTAWFCLWPLFIRAFKDLLIEICLRFAPLSSEKPPRAGLQKFGKIFILFLLGLGLIVFLLAWVGYAIVGIFDDSAPTALIHNVGSTMAFGGLAAGAILWFFPLILAKRFRKYPVVIIILVILMVVVAVSLMFGPFPEAWYTANSFWQWMSFFAANLWIFSLWFSVRRYREVDPPNKQ